MLNTFSICSKAVKSQSLVSKWNFEWSQNSFGTPNLGYGSESFQILRELNSPEKNSGLQILFRDYSILSIFSKEVSLNFYKKNN